MSTIKRLVQRGLIKPPSFVAEETHYETIMGSVAYGVSNDLSDTDIYGFCIPPKEVLFPHLHGDIIGFGKQHELFEQFQEHHIKDASANAGAGRQYDVSIYSIIKYFQLCMENNPNMIDSLFTPANAVLHCSKTASMVRDNRRMFLHKGCWHKFKGYAYQQMGKMENKRPVGKRLAIVQEHGFDVKFAYHVVRLLDEVEQILTEGDVDLQRNREQLKSIRRGEWTQQQIKDYFTAKERELEAVYSACKLPPAPDEEKIKRLLLDCLEHHFGNLNGCVFMAEPATRALEEIEAVLQRYRLQATQAVLR